MTDIVERLLSNETLPVCPYDRRSPDYWTAPDDKPCPVCGTLNDPDAPDLCRGADTRVMKEAATEISRLRAELQRSSEQAAQGWQPIETAPKEPDAMFLVCAVGDDRGPFVVRADIMWQARKAGTPHHLGLSYLTHWQPLPAMPENSNG